MTPLPWLDPEIPWFPDPETALDDPDGLLALGGDLSVERLQMAYRQGIFPWYSAEQPLLWWSPNPRCVISPSQVHISRSLRRTLNSRRFRVTTDKAFADVIQYCGQARSEGTWITPEMQRAYVQLHRMGIAHSFEAWNPEGELVGGLYGVAQGSCFFGESMFARETNASKVVFVHCLRQLEAWNYAIMDCQVENPHLLSLGAELVPRREFLSILRENIDRPPEQRSWEMQWHW